MNPILKSNAFYKKSDSLYNFVNEMLNTNYNKQETLDMIKKIHNLDIYAMYYKDLHFYVLDDESMWGGYKFDNKYDFEMQKIAIYSFENIKNNLYKNALTFATYLHETTHEKQRDYFMFNNIYNIPEENAYNNLLNLEIFCQLEAKLPKYEQRLVEIDAIYNTIIRYDEILSRTDMSNNIEVQAVQLYNCVRYFASINGKEHHTYCPDKFTTDSSNLVEYYKDFYSTYRSKYNNETIDDLIKFSDKVARNKKDELKQQDFENVKKEINKKTQIIYQIMKNSFDFITDYYYPSKDVCKHLKITDNNQWQEMVLNSENIVKLSALICDDLHTKYSTSNPSILNKLELDIERE